MATSADRLLNSTISRVGAALLLCFYSTGTARGDEGLVADYRFDEGTGTILHDRAAAGC
ncbi:MAG: hypothetical protein ACLQNE_29845 [Thermoguttaceae bacterium]